MAQIEVSSVIERKVAEEELFLKYKMNPLRRIEIGTVNELKTAQIFANIIVDGMGYSAEKAEQVKLFLMAVALHCIYASYVEITHYPYFPTVDSLISFLQMQVIEEEVCNDDGNPHKEIILKDFCKIISYLNNFQHIPNDYYNESLEVDYVHMHYGGLCVDKHLITKDTIQTIYPMYSDVFKVYVSRDGVPHPFILKTFYLFGSYKRSVLQEIVGLTVCALNRFVFEHEECTMVNILHACREAVYNCKKKEKNPFEIDMEVERKGRRFKFRLPFFNKKKKKKIEEDVNKSDSIDLEDWSNWEKWQ